MIPVMDCACYGSLVRFQQKQRLSEWRANRSRGMYGKLIEPGKEIIYSLWDQGSLQQKVKWKLLHIHENYINFKTLGTTCRSKR